MQNRQKIREEIELVSTLKVITQAYEEISVMRMQKIRGSVLQTRDFLSSISSVFYDVKNSHKRFTDFLKTKQSNISPYSILPTNGKKLCVFLSANEKMNGDIISKVFRAFSDFVKNNDCEVMIVGKIGKEMYAEHGLTKDFEFFKIPDTEVRIEDMRMLVDYMRKYQEINIFYGKFQSIVNQDAVVSNITGDKPFDVNDFSNGDNIAPDPSRKFLYEPSIEELYTFFETQIFSSLFKQTVDESHLSRYASRIKAMEEALGNIDSKSKKLVSEERKVKKSLANKKQNGAMAGIALWS